MHTLTFATPCTSRSVALSEARRYVARLRRVYGALPALYVPELHKSGSWHCHVALGLWIPHKLAAATWGNGHVWVSKMKGRARGRGAARHAAGYVGKYLSKSFAEGAPGEHRYECAQGFQPTCVRVEGLSLQAAVAFTRAVFAGELPAFELDSHDWTEYRGPPLLWMAWN